jgi:hypothetical protein
MKPFAEIASHPRVTIIETSDEGGAALVKRAMGAGPLRVIFSIGLDWDHVSVSLPNRTPNYQEMKQVKRIFFEKNETAIEYHPAESDYISVNDNVLHLWRPQKLAIPMPPYIMV